MSDADHGGRVSEYCGLVGRDGLPRLVEGGKEWEAEPYRVRPPIPAKRLHAETLLRNLRSNRGGL
ncbi:hypothetical protein [Streptomyces sp. DT171]|uniref:hypothetical protein n=1 Tax=Streptomyces sp. DT171 TaxID=3416524 RepID=UPI003CF52AC8